MYSITKYVLAAIHDGAINPQTVIDRYEDTHRAKTIELGIDVKQIYEGAKKAKSRNTITSLLMMFPAGYIIYAGMNFFTNSWYFGFEYLLEMVFPALMAITVCLFVKQMIVNSCLKNITIDETAGQGITSEDQNAIISGGYSPFTGYGFDLDSWSFTVNSKRPGQSADSNPQEIDIKELLEVISKKVKSNISGTELSDRIFVNGKDVRKNKLFLETITSKPNVIVPQEVVDSYIGKSNEDVRHYRVLTIPMWNGQVCLSVFLRFTIIGEQLFAESRFFMISPIKENLMILDNVFSRSGFAYYYRLLFVSAIKSLYSWVSGPGVLLRWFGKIQEAIIGDPENKLKKKNDTYNYGHPTSLRESWSILEYQRYFQMLDKDQSYKIVQHIIINSIVDYLESKGISTEDIKERQTTILNSGVMVTGGTVKADQMTVGTGAVLKNKFTNAMPKKK
ncbi:MAG: hypothetical protein GY737_29370 [Desulfobacteraceae bacterium]|nr:hypothetical protein [Desulfobacteraceae bacterium]